MNERHDDLQEIIDAALREMAAEEGDGFDPQACNLAEFCRRTGLTRSRARTVRAHGFRALPHGNSGRRAAPGVLAGHTGTVDDLLRKGVTNSQVIFERLLGELRRRPHHGEDLYRRAPGPRAREEAAGGPAGLPRPALQDGARRGLPDGLGLRRGRAPRREQARIACFAMVCHHCGGAHVEFFPNARQRTSSSGCCTRSRRWACPRPCSPTT